MTAGSTTAIVMRRCLIRTALPFSISAGFALLGAWAVGVEASSTLPAEDLERWTGESGIWLQLPAFVAVLVCCITAIETWPTLSRNRRGVDWVMRATPRPLHGCAAAIVGALLALSCWLLPLTLVAAWTSPAPHAYRVATAASSPVLEPKDSSIQFTGPGTTCRELRLRPIAVTGIPGQGQAAQIQVDVGQSLLTEPLIFAGGMQLARIPIDNRIVDEVVLRRVDGDLPLVFPPGSVELVESEARSRLLNASLAMASYLFPAALALALATLAAPFAALPTNLALVIASLLVQTLGKLGPTSEAMTQLGRGRWLMTEPYFHQCLSSLGTGLVAMILAILVRWRIH